MKTFKTVLLIAGILVAGLAYNSVAQSNPEKQKGSKDFKVNKEAAKTFKHELKHEFKAEHKHASKIHKKEVKQEMKHEARIHKAEAKVHKAKIHQEIREYKHPKIKHRSRS